jgi:hypothetical protein
MALPKELRKIAKAAEDQGWRIEETKKGHRFVPPDKTQPAVQAHGTPSDVRAQRNLLSQLKRSGLMWPWPPKKGT